MSALAAKSSILYKELQRRGEKRQLQLQLQPPWSSGSGGCLLLPKNAAFLWVDTASRNKNSTNNINKNVRRDVRVEALWPELSRPTSVELEPINDCDHLDQILLRAQDLSQPILIDWMASWCRKCIYLKPKLEKLAAEFDTKLKFYYVDINKVSKALVKRGNISKMPTIQIWKDGEMKSEVIGGHKAWVVIEEVREMIKKFV